ncbi:MAG: D-alanyl-D-alanine carboxypeptidase [Clostridiales bacterium]|nr:D-alanyl-D-alanine carboxypeptidase [Clostridiales bacterium]
MLVLILLAIAMINNNHVLISNAESIDGLSAKSYIVVDGNGKVLISNHADERVEVASICKLMTTLLTLESIDAGVIGVDDKVIASEYACSAEGSQAFLDAGSEYCIRDLIKSVVIASANDSAIVLAEVIGGNEENFTKSMNLRAQELGMKNTLYGNATGLSGNKQYSTAQDTAIILNEISKYEMYQNDCKIWMDKLIHPSGRETELVNTNRLVRYYPNCKTGKTGYTDEAGYCLSSTAEKDNLKLTCVVLGCDSSADRFSDSVALYNKAFANYKSEKIIDKDLPIENDIVVKRGKSDRIQVVAESDYYLTIPRQGEDYTIEYNVKRDLSAPIKRGDVVGAANIVVDGEVVATINLIADMDIDKESYIDIVNRVVSKFGFVN